MARYSVQLICFGGSGYPQFRANRTPFLLYASEQPSRAAATIPSLKDNSKHYLTYCFFFVE